MRGMWRSQRALPMDPTARDVEADALAIVKGAVNAMVAQIVVESRVGSRHRHHQQREERHRRATITPTEPGTITR